MKYYTLLSIFLISPFLALSQLNVSYVSDVQYSQNLSDVWGYVAPDSTEYALVGVRNGVSIINLTDPANPVESDFVPGPNSTWRDIKTWGDHAYVTNETSGGLLVIDLSPLPDSVNYHYWAPNLPGLGTLSSCHNLWIDEFGYIYLTGCNINGGGLVFIDAATDPENPSYAGKGATQYSHDVFVRNNIAYSSEINIGVFAAYDVSDKGNPVLLATQQTPASTTHNAWLSDDDNILFTTDETGSAPVSSYDVSDLNNIVELDQFVPLETLGEGVIPHNVHVWNDWLIISYYTDGCIIVDAQNPDNLIEVGNFDTYLPPGSGFNGAWGAYPYLPSGLVLVSDIGNGLYILAPNYIRACYLEGKVTDAATGLGINGATVDIIGELSVENTSISGDYKTGIATAGTYEVKVSKAGYVSKTVTVELENDVVIILDVELEQLPSFTFSGIVKDAETEEAIEGAKVQVINDEFEYNLTTDATGQFTVNTFFEGNYDLLAGKWGFRAAFNSSQDFNETNNSIEIQLERGIEDVFSLDLGWAVEGNANQGQFEMGDPIGVFPPQASFYIQPEDDVVEDPGNSCFVTGNTSDVFGGVQLTGTTRIVSPEFDLTDMNEPRISYYTWLFTANIQGNPVPGNDKLIVKLDNGIESKIVDELEYTNLFMAPEWTPREIIVADTITPTANMRIIFQIGDTDPSFTDVAEAAVDYFKAFDENPTGLNESFTDGIILSAFPNPSASKFTVNYSIDDWGGESNLLVYNLLGQKVEAFKLNSSHGKVLFGSKLDKGMYFVKIEQEGKVSRAIKITKQ